MKLIYVASPYAGDVERNIRFAKQACRHVMEQGHAFFAPHLLYPKLLDDTNPLERQAGLDMGLVILSRCDELWAGGDRISPGMAQEIEQAKTLGIPIRYLTTEQILNGQKPAYAIWAKERPDGPLSGQSGFLCENRKRLIFSAQQDAEAKLRELHTLCPSEAPVADYECVVYPAEYASDRNMHMETLRDLELTPAYSQNMPGMSRLQSC
jgi:hypothetical protein